MKRIYSILILSLFVMFMTTSCFDPSVMEGSSSKSTNLLDLSEVPVFEESQNASGSGERLPVKVQKPVEAMVFSDDFNSFNLENWFVLEEKTGNSVPEKARIDEGNLIIESLVTDRNPFFHSRPVAVGPGDILRIRRRVLPEPANNYTTLGMVVYGTDDESMPFNRESYAPLAILHYLDFQYDPGRFPTTKGTVLSMPDWKETGQFKVWTPLTGQWVEEDWEIHTGTGKVICRINGQETQLQGSPLNSPFVRISMDSYGWHTGHKVTVDYVHITLESTGDSDSWYSEEQLAGLKASLSSDVDFREAAWNSLKENFTEEPRYLAEVERQCREKLLETVGYSAGRILLVSLMEKAQFDNADLNEPFTALTREMNEEIFQKAQALWERKRNGTLPAGEWTALIKEAQESHKTQQDELNRLLQGNRSFEIRLTQDGDSPSGELDAVLMSDGSPILKMAREESGFYHAELPAYISYTAEAPDKILVQGTGEDGRSVIIHEADLSLTDSTSQLVLDLPSPGNDPEALVTADKEDEEDKSGDSQTDIASGESHSTATSSKGDGTGDSYGSPFTSGQAQLRNDGTHSISIGAYGDIEYSLKEIIASDDFKNHFPNVKIEIMSSDFGGHHNRLVTQVAKASGTNDIEFMEIGYLSRFISEGGFRDLSGEYAKRAMDQKKIAPYAVSAAIQRNGPQIALPYSTAPAVMYYRKSITEKAGVNMNDIETWEEFLDIAQRLTRDVDGDGEIDQWAITHPVDWSMLNLHGGMGGWMDGNEPYSPDRLFLNNLELMREMNNRGIHADYTSWSGEWINGFKENKVVLMASGNWFGNHLQNWMDQTPEHIGDYRIAPLPSGAKASYGGDYAGIPLATPGEKLDISMDIIEYLCTVEAAQISIMKTSGTMTTLTSLRDHPIMDETFDYFGGQAIRQVFRDIISEIPAQSVSEYDPIARDIYNKAIAEVIYEGIDPEKAYDDAVKEVKSQM